MGAAIAHINKRKNALSRSTPSMKGKGVTREKSTKRLDCRQKPMAATIQPAMLAVRINPVAKVRALFVRLATRIRGAAQASTAKRKANPVFIEASAIGLSQNQLSFPRSTQTLQSRLIALACQENSNLQATLRKSKEDHRRPKILPVCSAGNHRGWGGQIANPEITLSANAPDPSS